MIFVITKQKNTFNPTGGEKNMQNKILIAVFLLTIFIFTNEAFAVQPVYFIFGIGPWCQGKPYYWDQNQPETINAELLRYVKNTIQAPASPNIKIGFCIVLNTLESRIDTLTQDLNNLLSASIQEDMPVQIVLEGIQWWEQRWDIWNWYDSTFGMLDTKNTSEVEWIGWDPSFATKLSWTNWGAQFRRHPQANLAGKRMINECLVSYDLLVPIILQWFHNLPADKKYLFAGIKVGWECGIGYNNWYYPNGNSYFDQYGFWDASHDPTSGLNVGAGWPCGMPKQGYNTLKTLGIKSSGDISVGEVAQGVKWYLDKISQHVNSLGVPRHLLFTHAGGHYSPFDKHYPLTTATNNWALPGYSMYGYLPSNFSNLSSVLDSMGNPGWCVAEWYWAANDKATWKSRFNSYLQYRNCRNMNIYYWDDFIAHPEGIQAVREVMSEWTLQAWQSVATPALPPMVTPAPTKGSATQMYMEPDSTNKWWVGYDNLSESSTDCNPESGMNDGNYYYQASDDNADSVLERQNGWIKYCPNITQNGYYKVYVSWADYSGNGNSANRCDWEIFSSKVNKRYYGMLSQAQHPGCNWVYLGSFYFEDDIMLPWIQGRASDAYLRIDNRHQVNGKNGYFLADACKFVLSDNVPAPDEWQSFAPTSTGDQFPDCSVQVRDTDGGLKSGSAQFSYSRDGGNTWSQWLGRNCIKSEYNLTASVGNNHYYRDIYNSNTDLGAYKIQSGDVLHYDVYVTNSNTQCGIEIEFRDGTYLRDSGAKDQNNISSHPYNNLAALGYLNKWYHREIPIPSTFNGKLVSAIEAAHETDTVGVSAFYLRNIAILNNGRVNLRIYGDEPITDFALPVEKVSYPPAGTWANEVLTTVADPTFSFSAVNGTTAYTTITANDVPFGQYSTTNNKIQFRARDVSENVGDSSAYNVSIQAGVSTNTPTRTNTPVVTPNTPTRTNTPSFTTIPTSTFTPTKTNTPAPPTATRTYTQTYTLTPSKTYTPIPSTNTPSNTPKPYTIGDANCDGNITPGDALLTFQIYLKLYTPIGNESCDVNRSADFNEDGSITPGDALCIFREYLRNPC